jgi:hypothetical protein
MEFFNLQRPFFRPLFPRVATFAIAAGWALFEFGTGSPGWAVMFGAIAVWCGYQFFIIFDPENYKDQTK